MGPRLVRRKGGYIRRSKGARWRPMTTCSTTRTTRATVGRAVFKESRPLVARHLQGLALAADHWHVRRGKASRAMGSPTLACHILPPCMCSGPARCCPANRARTLTTHPSSREVPPAASHHGGTPCWALPCRQGAAVAIARCRVQPSMQ